MKKKRRDVSPEICQPGISAVCPGIRIHLAAELSVVRFASMTLRPSTERATATRSGVELDSRTENVLPLSASM